MKRSEDSSSEPLEPVEKKPRTLPVCNAFGGAPVPHDDSTGYASGAVSEIEAAAPLSQEVKPAPINSDGTKVVNAGTVTGLATRGQNGAGAGPLPSDIVAIRAASAEDKGSRHTFEDAVVLLPDCWEEFSGDESTAKIAAAAAGGVNATPASGRMRYCRTLSGSDHRVRVLNTVTRG